MSQLVKEIKSYRTPDRIFNRFFPAMLFAYWISPYLSAFCIKKKIIPNTITVLMIPTALIASVCFALPFLPCKIIGVLFFHLWFAVDMSDGQVARYTSTFSKYGEELDYVAHHICHIFFIASFVTNIYFIRYDLSFINLDYTVVVLIFACAMVFVEYAFRNECSIGAMIRYKNNDFKTKYVLNRKKGFFAFAKRCVRIVLNSLNCIDNYIMIGSLVVFLDIYLHTYVLLILTCLLILLTLFANIKLTLKYLITCYKGE